MGSLYIYPTSILSIKSIIFKPSFIFLFIFFRKMFILGFVVDIITLTEVSKILLNTQEYVLTYKFSQDHLELFFNSIRRSG